MSATGRGREREADDYYTTPSWAVRRLIEQWRPRAGTLVEPSAGNGAIIRAAAALDVLPISASRWIAFEIREEEGDALKRLCPTFIESFLGFDPPGDDQSVSAVIGNPPYALAWEFIHEARRRFPAADVCFLLRIAFAASDDRNDFMRRNPPDVFVLPNRPSFTGEGSDSADYAWFVWPPHIRAQGDFVVLKTTPLAERQRDRGHRVMIEPAQRALFG